MRTDIGSGSCLQDLNPGYNLLLRSELLGATFPGPISPDKVRARLEMTGGGGAVGHTMGLQQHRHGACRSLYGYNMETRVPQPLHALGSNVASPRCRHPHPASTHPSIPSSRSAPRCVSIGSAAGAAAGAGQPRQEPVQVGAVKIGEAVCGLVESGGRRRELGARAPDIVLHCAFAALAAVGGGRVGSRS